MRIALFSECYSPIVNGVVVAVSILHRELMNLGHDVRIFAPTYPGHRDVDDTIYRLPSISLPTNPRYPVGIPILPRRLRRKLLEFAPEVIHTHSLFSTGRVAAHTARRLKVPLIFTYHTLLEAYTHYVPFPRPFVRWLARSESRRFANACDHVVVPGPAALEALRAYGVKRPMDTIPTGADLSLLDGQFTAPICQRWGIPPGSLVVTYVGRIAIEKNVELLLTSFASLKNRISTAHLLLIGAGPWQQQILQVAARLGVADRVHVSGFHSRHEVFHALSHCHVFAFPSLTDTQGIVVLEAMACGLPTVAAKSAAVTEIIRPDTDGILVEPEPEAFAEALRRLLEDPCLREQMGACARQRAHDFSATTCACQVAEVYRKAIAARNGSLLSDHLQGYQQE